MPKHDWEKIEPDIRAGILSLREIGRKHNVPLTTVRKHIKEKNVKRDLTAKIKEKVRTKLVLTQVRTSGANDDQVVEEVSDQVVAIQVSHRKDIRQAKTTVMILQDELLSAIQHRVEIEGSIQDETKEDSKGKRRATMLNAVSLPSHSLVAKNLSVALKHLIGLERQAFSMDEEPPDDPGKLQSKLTDHEKKLYREAARIVSQRIIERAQEDAEN